MHAIGRGVLMFSALLAVAGCGGSAGPEDSERGAFRPIDPKAAVFWDRQTNETAALLDALIAEFNAEHTGLPLRVEHTGNYGEIYQKTVAGLRAGVLPALAVAYESMVVEYADRGSAVDLRPLFEDPETGFDAAARADFVPAMLESSYYPEFDGAMLSFPFTKSVLVMYVNETVLREAGIETVPETWDTFLDQCRRIQRETGKTPLSFDVDASTFNGIVFSMGGTLLEGGVTQYDGEASRAALALIETLAREKLLMQNPPRTFNDQIAFGNDAIAFAFRPSSSIPYFEQVKGGKEGWTVARLPQRDPARPGTVLYGANLVVFRTTLEQIDTAWAFARFFARPDVMARWCAGSGYVPIRRAAAEHEAMVELWSAWPPARVPFDSLAFAHAEPRVHGWQEVRSEIDDALTAVVTGMRSADATAATLKSNADRILAARAVN